MSVHLSEDDLRALEAVVATEVGAGWRGDTLDNGVTAIVDTILNRVQSSRYPQSVSDVINQYKQFSAINHPSGYGSWQKVPEDRINRQNSGNIRAAVQKAVANRALGGSSWVGGHLNYANPHHSSPSNLGKDGWVSKMMQDPFDVIGSGKSIHYHGTPPSGRPVDPNIPVSLDRDAINSIAPPVPAPKGGEAGTYPLREMLFEERPDYSQLGPLARHNNAPSSPPLNIAASGEARTSPVQLASANADLSSLFPDSAPDLFGGAGIDQYSGGVDDLFTGVEIGAKGSSGFFSPSATASIDFGGSLPEPDLIAPIDIPGSGLPAEPATLPGVPEVPGVQTPEAPKPETDKKEKPGRGYRIADTILAGIAAGGGPPGMVLAALGTNALHKRGISPTRAVVNGVGDLFNGIGATGFATPEGFQQTRLGNAYYNSFNNGRYDPNKALAAGLFATDDPHEFAMAGSLDQQGRQQSGNKTIADAVMESFGALF